MLVKCMLVYMSYVSLYLYTSVIVYDFVHAYVAVFVLLVNVWCESLCLYVCLVASMYMWLLVCRLYVFNGMPVCVSVCVGVFICLSIMCII